RTRVRCIRQKQTLRRRLAVRIWVCVARAGRDAVTPKTCGTFNVHKTYGCLDIVEYDGNGYLARRDAPGVPGIPGDGWQLVSRSGRNCNGWTARSSLNACRKVLLPSVSGPAALASR